MSIVDPFDLPPDAATVSPSTAAERGRVSVQAKLVDDERRRAKVLEIKLASVKAELENVVADRDRLQATLDACDRNETALVKGALDAQGEAEMKWFAERERAQALVRENQQLRGLNEHLKANATAASADVARLSTTIDEIAKAADVVSTNPDQLRRAIAIAKARSQLLDQVLDGILDGMTSQVRAMLSQDDADVHQLDTRHPLALHLHVAGALEYHDGWRWTVIGEALRHRRRERLGGRQRSGEYEVT